MVHMLYLVMVSVVGMVCKKSEWNQPLFFQLKNIKYSSMEVLAIRLNLPSFATLI